jgi:biotin carboxyl carrier protein
MSSYYVTIGNNEYQVNLNGTQAMVDGKPVQDIQQSIKGSGARFLQPCSRSNFFVNSMDSNTLEILIGSRRMIARVDSLQKRFCHPNVNSKTGKLTAPMPGLVTSILITEGKQVQENQVLMVMESMKMQMQLRATINGTVRAIAVRIGSQVEKGTLLITIDKET